MLALQWEWRRWGYTRGYGWLYISRIRNIKQRNKSTMGIFGWGRHWVKEKKTYTYVPYSSFEMLETWPLNIAKRAHCPETSLQDVKLATKQKPFDLCMYVRACTHTHTHTQTHTQTHTHTHIYNYRHILFLCFADRASQYIYLSN